MIGIGTIETVNKKTVTVQFRGGRLNGYCGDFPFRCFKKKHHRHLKIGMPWRLEGNKVWVPILRYWTGKEIEAGKKWAERMSEAFGLPVVKI